MPPSGPAPQPTDHARPRALVLDFDGTLTSDDVGDALCDRFAPPAWRAIDDRWVRHELSLPEAQRAMWALVRATRGQAIEFLRDRITMRPGLGALVDAAAARAIPVWLASGGFDFYIEALLGDLRARFACAFYNTARFDGDRVAIAFPHAPLACGRCAVCKGRVCDLARADGAEEVLFVGDGHSDRCVVGHADGLAAVRGSTLARHLDERGVAYRPFDRLDELTGWLAV
jgi:2-hydroxy-3-keto-5-methylthiopentenyl-1-phosphate phosphatase